MSENEVLRRICCTKRDEVIEGWRKVQHKELHTLYSAVGAIKSRRMEWAGHVACKVQSCEYSNELLGPIEGKEFLDHTSVLLTSHGLLHGVR
jgi:hypothetical protein